MFEIYQDVFAGSQAVSVITSPLTYTFFHIKPYLVIFSFQVGAKCVRATYTDQGETVGVKNEYVSPL